MYGFALLENAALPTFGRYRNSLFSEGLCKVGLAGFEPTTSTTPRFGQSDFDPAKTKVKENTAEALHQMLHQLFSSGSITDIDRIVNLLLTLLEPEQVQRLLDAS